jgi:thiamine biosynthesis lipoprotein
MNRRDFLQPRRLAHTAGQLLAAVEELETPQLENPPEEIALLRAARRAMATTFEVLLPYGTPDALALAESAFDEIDRLEQQLTVYRNTSEVSRLNQLAPFAPVPVEEGLFGLLALSARITEETEGAFDITAGALIKAWGFYRGPRRVPAEAEQREALNRVGMRHIVLNPEEHTVRYLRPGLEINLGSIGKGYALDRAAEYLRSEGNLTAALLHGGHSSVYAIGNEPGDRRGWAVGIRHPWDLGRRLAVVRLRDRALGTSAATFQHLEYNGRKLGHILDPRTGWPAEGIASASVVAPTAAEADALATAFFILGVDKARAYCEQHPGIGAVLVPQDECPGGDGPAASPVILGLSPDEVSVGAP